MSCPRTYGTHGVTAMSELGQIERSNDTDGFAPVGRGDVEGFPFQFLQDPFADVPTLAVQFDGVRVEYPLWDLAQHAYEQAILPDDSEDGERFQYDPVVCDDCKERVTVTIDPDADRDDGRTKLECGCSVGSLGATKPDSWSEGDFL